MKVLSDEAKETLSDPDFQRRVREALDRRNDAARARRPERDSGVRPDEVRIPRPEPSHRR